MRGRRPIQVLAKNRQEALHSGVCGVFGVELGRTGTQDVAAGQIKGSGIAMMRIKPGQKAGSPGLDLDLVDISERLLDEQDALAVVRELGALAESGQASDVCRKILVRRGGRDSRRFCA